MISGSEKKIEKERIVGECASEFFDTVLDRLLIERLFYRYLVFSSSKSEKKMLDTWRVCRRLENNFVRILRVYRNYQRHEAELSA